MNCKVAKRLRKEANYHPKMDREYVFVKTHSNRSHIVLHDADPRTLYKELKKEYYRNKGAA